MGIIFLKGHADYLRVRMGQIQVVAENSHIHLVLLKQMLQIMGIAGRKGRGAAGVFLH